MKRLFPSLAVVAAVCVVSGGFADSAYDRCPVCGANLGPFPTRSGQAHRRQMMDQHLASHRGGGDGGYSPASDPFMQFASQILGQMASQAGEEFAKTLWGDPQADAAREQVIAAERTRLAEEARVQAEAAAREREARHQALMGMMKRLPGSGGELKPKRLGESGGDLAPKRLGDSPEYQELMGGLARAAALSKLAARAAEGEDARLLAEEALRAAEGEAPASDIPDIGPGQEVQVSGEQAAAFRRIQKEEKDTRERYGKVAEELARRHDQKESYAKVRAKAEETVKEVEKAAAAAPPERKPEEEDKLAKARALLEQAGRHEKKAGEDLANLKQESEQLGKEMGKQGKAKEEFVKGLGK